VDDHSFDISIGSLISVFNLCACIQIKVVEFNVDLWRLSIFDNVCGTDEVEWFISIAFVPLLGVVAPHKS